MSQELLSPENTLGEIPQADSYDLCSTLSVTFQWKTFTIIKVLVF